MQKYRRRLLLSRGLLGIISIIVCDAAKESACSCIHRDQHHSSLLLHYSSLSYTRYAGIFRHAAGPCGSCSIIHNKYANHMTMTTSGQFVSWPHYLKTKGNVNIKLWDLPEILIVYILFSTFQSVYMVLTVNKSDVRRFIAWIESADWNAWYIWKQNKNQSMHS